MQDELVFEAEPLGAAHGGFRRNSNLRETGGAESGGLKPCGSVLLPGQTAEGCSIRKAISEGQRDRNKLTDMVFHKRHPELGGRKIKPGEKKLINEWLSIRKGVDGWLTIDEIARILHTSLK